MFDWARCLRKQGIFLFPDGRPAAPHISLSADIHSDSYFYPEQLSSNPSILREAAGVLIDKIYPRPDFRQPTLVVTPSIKTQCLGYEMARQLDCRAGHLEERGEQLILKESFLNLETVLVANLTFNPQEIEAALKAIEDRGNVLPFIPVVYNSFSIDKIDSKEIVFLIKRTLVRWSKNECPLCEQGSPALSPPEAWQKFFSARQ